MTTTTHAPPGSPEAGMECLCSPLLNSRGAGLRQTPTDTPDGASWLVDPVCRVHVPDADSALWAAT